jgi:hypothetical protein
MKRILLSLTLLVSAALSVQAQKAAAFAPPFNFNMVFSGNFGEIRANHFHGGLDFKTQGGIGKQVRALGNGYISRIRVTHGSGYILDVKYDNGYTTINRHLSAFVGKIAQRVDSLQYAQHTWEVEIVPSPQEYPVKTGQIIALSGNTGYSFGPHLHLDVIEDSTGMQVDPLPFFRRYVKDTVAPRAVEFRIFPQAGLGVSDGMTAWGVVGVGLKAYDYMNDVRNRYGVHTLVMRVDGQEVFRSVVDRFDPSMTRMINAWASGQFMKSFIEPGNTLPMFHASNGNRGLLTINEERPYQIEYTLSDALGNTSKAHYTLTGKRMNIPSIEEGCTHVFRWNRANVLQMPGLHLVVPRGNLYNDIQLHYAVTVDSGDLSYTHQLSRTRIPLQGRAELRLRLRNITPSVDTTKLYIAGINSKGKKYNLGGSYEAGYMKGYIRELGTVTVAVDTVPPTITPIQANRWRANGRIIYKVEDEETGIRSYRGTIDGEYALFGIPNSTNDRMEYKVDPKRIARGKHLIEVTVTDNRGNTTVRQDTFIY